MHTVWWRHVLFAALTALNPVVVPAVAARASDWGGSVRDGYGIAFLLGIIYLALSYRIYRPLRGARNATPL